jgi:hypothetical protein
MDINEGKKVADVVKDKEKDHFDVLVPIGNDAHANGEQN